MPFTITCQDASLWDASPRKALVLAQYGEVALSGSESYGDGNQHDYDQVSQDMIEAVLGPVASGTDSIGLYLDQVNEKAGGFNWYSIPRLADALLSRHPQLATQLGGRQDLVNAINSGEVEVSEDEYPMARLVANILNLARNPVGAKPAVVILW